MSRQETRRARSAAIAVIAVAAIIALTIYSALAVSYNPSVTFRLRTGKADIIFQNPIHFAQIRVRSNAVLFNGVQFGVEKVPAAAPNLIATITTWSPAAPSGTAIEFVGASLGVSVDIYFNLTGLQSLSYDVLVNGLTQATLPGPSVSFLWSNWNVQNDIAIIVSAQAPPGSGLPFSPMVDSRFAWPGILIPIVAVMALAILIRSGAFRNLLQNKRFQLSMRIPMGKRIESRISPNLRKTVRLMPKVRRRTVSRLPRKKIPQKQKIRTRR